VDARTKLWCEASAATHHDGAWRVGACSHGNESARRVVQVLKTEYKKGVDVIYESVGGDMFKTAVDALAMRGRLLVIGMMSQYGDGWPVDDHPGLPEKLLKKSASLIGELHPCTFFLSHLQLADH
jgi:NADPH-dependent curcumin reductase CurA